MAELIRPVTRMRASFLAAMEEFRAEGREGDIHSMIGWDFSKFGRTWHTEEGFAAYVRETLAEEHTPREVGLICQTNWWWVEGEEYVGRISLRHRLTPELRRFGGHIGYDVRRSQRRKGHATAMLAAALAEANRRGIDPALLTCNADNLGSRMVIEANGGVLEDESDGKMRYWVPTSS
jgi:predicted acetyltransferase